MNNSMLPEHIYSYNIRKYLEDMIQAKEGYILSTVLPPEEYALNLGRVLALRELREFVSVQTKEAFGREY